MSRSERIERKERFVQLIDKPKVSLERSEFANAVGNTLLVSPTLCCLCFASKAQALPAPTDPTGADKRSFCTICAPDESTPTMNMNLPSLETVNSLIARPFTLNVAVLVFVTRSQMITVGLSPDSHETIIDLTAQRSKQVIGF